MVRLLMNNDGGYGISKNFDGIKSIDITSLVCEADKVKIGTSPDTKDNMVAEVEAISKNGEIIRTEIAVGNIAKTARARYDFDADKANSKNTVYPAILGFAYLMLSRGINYGDLDITTTLPIDDWNEENIRSINNQFCKEWKITFKYGHLKGKRCHFLIKDNLTSAQCAAGIWNHLLDDNGKIIRPFLGRKILGIDIGFETTCVYILENGQDDGRSRHFYIGMSDYNTEITKEINFIYKTRKTLEEMEDALKYGKLGNIDITNVAKRHYKRMVNEIINSISIIAPTTVEFTDIFLMGGGAKPTYEIFKSIPEFSRIEISKHPQRDNVIGSRKLAKYIWKGREYNA